MIGEGHMNEDFLEFVSHQDARTDERRGVRHIADILPLVLARITAATHSDTDRCPRLAAAASHIMPIPGVGAGV